MSYLISIKTAIILFPLIALIFTIPFILHQYHKYGSISFLRGVIIYSFILYMITVYFLVILPLPNRADVVYKPNMIRLIPFGFIGDIIRGSSLVLTDPKTYLKLIKEPCFYTVVFNIFMTIPFGMYLRYYYKNNLKETIKKSFLLSLFFEVTQVTGLYFIYKYPYRVFDVDDLITNTLGGVIGYYIMGIFDNFLPTRDDIDQESFKDGEVVSGFRRITIFFLDLFIYFLIKSIISIFIKTKYLSIIIFSLYYVIYPYFKNGETIGSRFLGVKLEFKNYRFIRILLRIIFIFAYYFYSPSILFNIIKFISNILNVDVYTKVIAYLALLFIILIFYIVNPILLIKNKKMFYDNLFKVEYKNTIKKENL